MLTTIRWSIGLVLALSIAATAFTQDNKRRDGNYWMAQSQLSKVSYVTGFFDGMALGHNFSVWKSLYGKGNGDRAQAGTWAVDRSDSTKYFSHVTAGQLTAGLDAFYADFQNRRITVDNAVWLVVNQIPGTPTVDEMMNFRRHAQ
jgi:hypothetical protein